MTMQWTDEAAIRTQLTRKWIRILSAAVEPSALFPLKIKLNIPDKANWPANWDKLVDWAEELRHKSRNSICYQLTEKPFRHPTLGNNTLPTHIIFTDGHQVSGYLGRNSEYQRFTRGVSLLAAPWPQLRLWTAKYPQKLLILEPQLRTYMNVLQWFSSHPPQGQYLRELRISGVDTKFIEQNKSILGELLDYILPPEHINADEKTFEDRYLLSKKANTIRFRILDDSQQIYHLSDFSVPTHQFFQCNLPQETFFIVENELTFLTFPSVPNACVIFGQGYAVEQLRRANWLQQKKLFYWGDLDTHGFQILSNARAIFPHIVSMLMELDVLLTHKDYWGIEETPTLTPPTNLTDEEYALCCHLQSGHFGHQVRLEQERIERTLVVNRLLGMRTNSWTKFKSIQVFDGNLVGSQRPETV